MVDLGLPCIFAADVDLHAHDDQPTITVAAFKHYQACAVVVTIEEGVTSKKWNLAGESLTLVICLPFAPLPLPSESDTCLFGIKSISSSCKLGH